MVMRFYSPAHESRSKRASENGSTFRRSVLSASCVVGLTESLALAKRSVCVIVCSGGGRQCARDERPKNTDCIRRRESRLVDLLLQRGELPVVARS